MVKVWPVEQYLKYYCIAALEFKLERCILFIHMIHGQSTQYNDNIIASTVCIGLCFHC